MTFGGESRRSQADIKDMLKYLDEVVADYKRCISMIGKLGYAAPQLLYYRDEVQDLIELLSGEQGVDLKERWARVRELDLQLRGRASDFVHEVGHSNFKQYQIVNNPPLTRWWWYMNRTTVKLENKTPRWQWWRKEE